MKTFTSDSHYYKLWALALPLIISNLSVPLFGLIDTALLAHLPSTEHLSAVSIAASLCTFILAGFNFLRMSSTALSAQSLGQANNQQNTFIPSCAIALGIGLIICLLRKPLSHLGLTLMGIDEPLFSLSLQYTQIRLLAAPAVLINYVCLGFLIGQQNAKAALMVLVAASFTNIAADFLFIHQLSMNSEGAAIASVLADYIGLVLALYFIVCRSNIMPTAPINWRVIQPLLSFNRRLWVRSISLLSVFIVFNALSESLGSQSMAVNAILLQLMLMQSYLLDGVAQATEARVGFFKGQQHQKALLTTLKVSFISSFLLAAVISFLLLFGKQIVIDILTNNVRLQHYLSSYYWWVIVLPFTGFAAYWLDGVAVGLAAAKAMQNAMLVAVCLVFMPLCIAHQWFGGSNHVLWGIFVIFSLSRAAFLWYFLSTTKALDNNLKIIKF